MTSKALNIQFCSHPFGRYRQSPLHPSRTFQQQKQQQKQQQVSSKPVFFGVNAQSYLVARQQQVEGVDQRTASSQINLPPTSRAPRLTPRSGLHTTEERSDLCQLFRACSWFRRSIFASSCYQWEVFLLYYYIR
jgi:hypothetical protein